METGTIVKLINHPSKCLGEIKNVRGRMALVYLLNDQRSKIKAKRPIGLCKYKIRLIPLADLRLENEP